MDPGVRSHGMKADPPGYLWSKYECFLMSGWWDILHSSYFNIKLWRNSTNGTKLWMNRHTERWKLYNPRHNRHKCQGINIDRLIFTLRSKFGSHCLIWKYDTHASNSVGDIRQNHWTIKYRSQWPTFILRSNIRPYWPIIPKYDVHTSNSLQDVTQNHWTMKYRSQ